MMDSAAIDQNMCDKECLIDKDVVATKVSSFGLASRVTKYKTLPQMLINTTFLLNERQTKEAIVGLDHLNSFQPSVQIVKRVSSGKRGLCLNKTEWTSLIDHADIITDFITTKRRPQEEIVLDQFEVQFQTVYGTPTVIIKEKINISTDDFFPNVINFQSSDWIGLLKAKECINQALDKCVEESSRVLACYSRLNNAVLNYLSLNIGTSDCYDDQTICKNICDFFFNLNPIMEDFLASGEGYIFQQIKLICLNSFTKNFKLHSFFKGVCETSEQIDV